MVTQIRDAWFWGLLIVAVLTAVNAIWMLVGPQHWYHDLPASVPDTGPYNEHFVRGFLDGHHWLLDLPGVYLPALLLVPLAIRSLKDA